MSSGDDRWFVSEQTWVCDRKKTCFSDFFVETFELFFYCMIWAQFLPPCNNPGWLGFTINSPNTPQVCIVPLMFYCSWSNMESPPSWNINIKYVNFRASLPLIKSHNSQWEAGMDVSAAECCCTQVLHQLRVFSGTISHISGVWSG